MKSYKILNIKEFTTALFAGEAFDSFLLAEADFLTDTTIHIDGRINKAYFDEQPEEEYTSWSQKKSLAFQIIKGKRLPISFKIVFCLSAKNIVSTTTASQTGINPSDVENYYININYKSGNLNLTSGMSMRTFSMDKSLPEYWDKTAEKFLKMNKIDFE